MGNTFCCKNSEDLTPTTRVEGTLNKPTEADANNQATNVQDRAANDEEQKEAANEDGK